MKCRSCSQMNYCARDRWGCWERRDQYLLEGQAIPSISLAVLRVSRHSCKDGTCQHHSKSDKPVQTTDAARSYFFVVPRTVKLLETRNKVLGSRGNGEGEISSDLPVGTNFRSEDTRISRWTGWPLHNAVKVFFFPFLSRLNSIPPYTRATIC